mmetsp:Transcript_10389/g.14888  ORF Transcript_10389/g.14888 Transcript_10389/m.14888 type:complete len:319 (+) Transcript_10389:102-1058(+)
MEKMAPQDTTSNSTDAMFMSLVSSQRQFLSKLGVRTDDSWINTPNQSNSPPSTPPPPPPSSFLTAVPVTTTQDSLLFSKRLSLGIGYDNFVLPEPELGPNEIGSADSADLFLSGESSTFHDFVGNHQGEKRKMFEEEEDMPEGHVRAKRRRSTLTFLNYIFQTENENEKMGEEEVESDDETIDIPLAEDEIPDDDDDDDDDNNDEHNSDKVEVAKPQSCGYNRIEYPDSDDEDYGVVVEDVDDSGEYERINRIKEITETVDSFESSMEAAQKSQQKIHDWDRKMGLKRSHSKTMRLSSRSRRKLRQICKEDLLLLSKR